MVEQEKRLRNKEHYRKWYAQNASKARANSRRYYKNNSQKVIETGKRWAKSHPEKVKAYRLTYKYGISWAEYRRLLLLQKGRCASCKSSFNGAPHVDHSHVTKKVRGLLCRECNLAIGLLKDSSVRCRLAADYLDRTESD